jgi:hypothetical protein
VTNRFPLAPSSALGDLINDWIGPGSTTGANSFDTNHKGNANTFINLDFPLEGGSNPFNNMTAGDLVNAQSPEQNPSALATPATIVDPRADNISGPFMKRMVSHCQDGTGHGLSPKRTILRPPLPDAKARILPLRSNRKFRHSSPATYPCVPPGTVTVSNAELPLSKQSL